MSDPISFADIEAVLAAMHSIAPRRRSAFLARLKNLQRLGLPGFEARGRGKVAQYGAGELAIMALAVEFTQLGLNPERVVRTIGSGYYPVTMALTTALGQPSKESNDEVDDFGMFLYFDPAVLDDLAEGYTRSHDIASNTLFYAGSGVVRDNIVNWTSSRWHGEGSPRISLINVTAMLALLDEVLATQGWKPGEFSHGVMEWTDNWSEVATRKAIEEEAALRGISVEEAMYVDPEA